MHDTNTDEPLVLLIGVLSSDAILSVLKASGRHYKIKRLDSGPANWATINSLLDSGMVKCVVIKLTSIVYYHLVSREYQEERDKLLQHIATKPHIIFIHETNLSYDEVTDAEVGDEESESFWSSEYFNTDIEVRTAVNGLLNDLGLNIIPYQTNAELHVMASNFLNDNEEGLLFRMYVPADRLWADGAVRLIELFRDYLARVEKVSVRLEKHQSRHGIVYEIFQTNQSGSIAGDDSSLDVQFRDFSSFLNIVIADPVKAEEILKEKHLNVSEISLILSKYAKEAKRLQVDMKHERDMKMLSIRHRLESELVDVVPIDLSMEAVFSLAESIVPDYKDTSKALYPAVIKSEINIGDGSSVTLNHRPQFINAANSIISQEINGNAHLSNVEQEILRLIKEVGPEREAELTEAVHELADSTVSKPRRLLAGKKLKGFLLQAAQKGGDLALKLLQSYIEKQIGL